MRTSAIKTPPPVVNRQIINVHIRPTAAQSGKGLPNITRQIRRHPQTAGLDSKAIQHHSNIIHRQLTSRQNHGQERNDDQHSNADNTHSAPRSGRERCRVVASSGRRLPWAGRVPRGRGQVEADLDQVAGLLHRFERGVPDRTSPPQSRVVVDETPRVGLRRMATTTGMTSARRRARRYRVPATRAVSRCPVGELAGTRFVRRRYVRRSRSAGPLSAESQSTASVFATGTRCSSCRPAWPVSPGNTRQGPPTDPTSGNAPTPAQPSRPPWARRGTRQLSAWPSVSPRPR